MLTHVHALSSPHPLFAQAASRCLQYKKVAINELELLQPAAAPESSFFPGSVPANATLEDITTTIDGDTVKYSGRLWQSSGAYAVPGVVATVSLPAEVFSNGQTVAIQVGGWTDSTYARPRWVRCPEITRRFTVHDSTPAQVGSAFGGIIYIILPGGLSLGQVSVNISSAYPSIR